MPTRIKKSNPEAILVELRGDGGVIRVSTANANDVSAKSAKAFDQALATIQTVARRTTQSIRALNVVDQPDSIELSFGLTLTSEANALIVNAGIEAQFSVKLVWQNKDKQHETPG